MSNTNNAFSKLNGTTIFVKTFQSSSNSTNSNTSFIPFVPTLSSSSDNITSTCPYDTIFEGNVIVNGTLTNPSDIQLKKNIQNIPNVESDKIMDICPVTYQLHTNNELENNAKHYGFIAQDMEHIFPELVQYNDVLTLKTINYLELIPLLISKMQKMQMQIDELTQKN
jgi:hypothetical protein